MTQIYQPQRDVCTDETGPENGCGGQASRGIPAHDELRLRTLTNSVPTDPHDGASGAFVAPFIDPDLEWDFRQPRVASINASGHKYGLVYPGVGWIVWRDTDALPEELIFWVNYLGDDMPTFALNFSRPGAQVVAQYYNPCSRSSSPTRSTTTPCSTSPTLYAHAVGSCPHTRSRRNRTDLAALRVVVRRGVTHDLSDLLISDIKRELAVLDKQAAAVHTSDNSTSFHH